MSVIDRFKSIGEYKAKIISVLNNFDYENDKLENVLDILRRSLNAKIMEDGTILVPMTSVEGLTDGAKLEYVAFRLFTSDLGKNAIDFLGICNNIIPEHDLLLKPLTTAAQVASTARTTMLGLSYFLGGTKIGSLFKNLTEEDPNKLDAIAENVAKYGASSLLYEPESWTSTELYKYKTWIRYEILESIYNVLKGYLDFHKAEFHLVEEGLSFTDWTKVGHLNWEDFQARLRSRLGTDVANTLIAKIEEIYLYYRTTLIGASDYYGLDEYTIDDYIITGIIQTDPNLNVFDPVPGTGESAAPWRLSMIPSFAFDYNGVKHDGIMRCMTGVDSVNDDVKSGVYKGGSSYSTRRSVSFSYRWKGISERDDSYYFANPAHVGNGSLLRTEGNRPSYAYNKENPKVVTGARLSWRYAKTSTIQPYTYELQPAREPHTTWYESGSGYLMIGDVYDENTNVSRVGFHNLILDSANRYYSNGMVNIPEYIWNAILNSADFNAFLGAIEAVVKTDSSGAKWVGINGELAALIPEIVNGDITDFPDWVEAEYPPSKTQNPESTWSPDGTSTANKYAGESLENNPLYGGNSILIDKPHDVVIPNTAPIKGLYHVYLMTAEQVQKFAQELWNPNKDLSNLSRLFNNPSDAIIALFKTFIDGSKVAKTATGAVKLGNITMDVSCYQVDATALMYDCGTCDIPEFYKNQNDYTDRTSVDLYLPFIGNVSLSAKDVIGHTISVKYIINLMNGECVAVVYTKSPITGYTTILSMYQGDMGYHIPISNREYSSLVKTLAGGGSSLLSGITGAVTGNIPMAISGFGGAIGSAIIASGGNVGKTSYSGQFTGANVLFCPREPFVTIRRSVGHTAIGFEKYDGITENATYKLQDCHGYTKIKSVHVDQIGTATKEEQAMIEDLLKRGVILP